MPSIRLIAPGTSTGVLVAYSGGMDSTVLLHLLANDAAIRARGLRALHVNHGLQADAEAWADYYGVPYREPADPLGLPNECALAACAALRLGAVVEFSHAFFRAHFVNGAIIQADDGQAV